MREALIEGRRGFVKGVKEAPRQFFAPLIALLRWMDRVYMEAMAPPMSTYTLPPVAKQSLLSAAHDLGISPSAALELAILQLRERAKSGAHQDSSGV